MKKRPDKVSDLVDGLYYAEIINVQSIGQAMVKGHLVPVCVITYRLHNTYVKVTQRYVMMLNYENQLRNVFNSAYGRLPANAKLSDLRGANLIIKLSTNVSTKTGKIFRNVETTVHLDMENVLPLENEPEELTIDFASADFRTCT